MNVGTMLRSAIRGLLLQASSPSLVLTTMPFAIALKQGIVKSIYFDSTLHRSFLESARVVRVFVGQCPSGGQ